MGDELVFYGKGQLAAPEHARQGGEVLSQTDERAMLRLEDGYWVELSRVDGGELAVTIVQPGSPMGRAMQVAPVPR